MEIAHLILVAALLGRAAAGAQDRRELTRNDPSRCPHCHGEPDVMRRAGIVSHGGFEYGMQDTRTIDGRMATCTILWIESAHHEIGFALGPVKISAEEGKQVRAELEELARVLPGVDPKARQLEPWLRLHLTAQRAERAYQRFLEVVRAKEGDFPDGATPWVLGTPYRGEGPHLGQRGKYEVLVVPTQATHVQYLRDQFGLSITRTQRWNVVERDTLLFSAHTGQDELRADVALHAHLVFNLAHNYVDGFEHYSYDTPIWIHEGLAHALEREISPKFNSFDSSEGAIAEMTRKSDLDAAVKHMIQAGEAPRLAVLANLKSYGEITLPMHFATWSMTRDLLETLPEGYARLNAELHGVKDAAGQPDSSGMLDRLRRVFQECIGMSYSEFDAAWQAWALAR
jgi:hypothetical protein